MEGLRLNFIVYVPLRKKLSPFSVFIVSHHIISLLASKPIGQPSVLNDWRRRLLTTTNNEPIQRRDKQLFKIFAITSIPVHFQFLR